MGREAFSAHHTGSGRDPPECACMYMCVCVCVGWVCRELDILAGTNSKHEMNQPGRSSFTGYKPHVLIQENLFFWDKLSFTRSPHSADALKLCHPHALIAMSFWGPYWAEAGSKNSSVLNEHLRGLLRLLLPPEEQ